MFDYIINGNFKTLLFMDLYKKLEELVTFSDYCTLHSKYNRTSLPCLVRDERGMEGVAATLYGERADDQTMWVCCEGRPRISLLMFWHEGIKR